MNIIHEVKSLDSHLKQFETPLYSTIEFEKYLNKVGCFVPDTEVLDVGAGCGAVVYHLGKKHLRTNFLGLDYNDALISIGKDILGKYSLPNVSLEVGNWFGLPCKYKDRFDGIFNVHALCCFKHIEKALDPLIDLNPRWIAFNSLFYDGPLDVLIHIRNHLVPDIRDDDPDGDFNIFSIPRMKVYLSEKGYPYFHYEKFMIPADLPKPPDGRRGTYTVKIEFEERVQFSGPVYLPWHFIVAKRK